MRRPTRALTTLVGLALASAPMLGGCGGATPTPPSTTPAPDLTATSSAAPVVTPPGSAVDGEVARFWFARPGANAVAVGPFAVTGDELVVRGACHSVSGILAWQVYDNSDEADVDSESAVVAEGEFTCDGRIEQMTVSAGGVRELAVLGLTGTPEGDDATESAWLTVANQ